MPKFYSDNIEQATKENNAYRKVLFTGKLQLVLMSLKPGEEIGEEIHNDHDQFFRFESGTGEVIINDEVIKVHDGMAVIVPAGAKHNVINTGKTDLKLYTIYAPPEHPIGLVQNKKNDPYIK